MGRVCFSRRRFVGQSSLFLAVCAFSACSREGNRPLADTSASSSNLSKSQQLTPTPTCGDYGPTPSQTAGPFYSPKSPQRQSLLTPDVEGTWMVVTGQVLSVNCEPLANSLVDVWQADARGEYDNTGNKLRGHQFTDAEGRYRIETIVPGVYPGRTRHLHIKVQPPERSVLTTQLYLPNEPLNEQDFLFQPALLMAVEETNEETRAQFDFVIG